tara:strand:+ start:5694 stop:7220 length:1527 start_codon:yes stop_codon:yes gene_type:complete
MEKPELNSSKLQSFIDNPKKGLWKMTMPFLIGLTVNSLYMLVDTMFVGKFVSNSSAALDAMGLIFPLMFIVMGLTFGLGSGATTLIAQFIGAKDKKTADNIASHTLLIGIIFPVIVITLVLTLGDSVIQLFDNTDEDTLKYATEYFNIMALGTIFMVLAIFFRSILSGEGETVLPMKILGFGTILNIILDPIFIIVLDLEVAGAAIATVISNGMVALSFMYFLIFKKVSYVSISFKKTVFKFDFKIIQNLFRLGIPASLSFAIMSVGIFANNIILNKADENIAEKVNCYQYLENQKCRSNYDCMWTEKSQTKNTEKNGICDYRKGGVIAGFTAASRLENLIMIPIIALSSSLVTMIGMFYGANRHDLIRSTINYGMRWAIQISLIFGAIFFIFSPFLLSIFTNDQKVILEGVKFFNIVSFSLPFVAISMITCRAMQGMNRPNPFLFLTLFRVILFAIPMAWIGVEYFDKQTEWVWWSVLLSSIISALAGLYWMNRIMNYDEKQYKKMA